MVTSFLLAALQFGGPGLPETVPGHAIDCRIGLADGSVSRLSGSTGVGVRDRSVLRGGGTMYAHIFRQHDVRYRAGTRTIAPEIVGTQRRGASLFLYFELPDRGNMHAIIENVATSGEASLTIRTQGPDLNGTCRVNPPLVALPAASEGPQ